MFSACAGYWEKVLLERSLQAHCSSLMNQNPCLLPSRSAPRLCTLNVFILLVYYVSTVGMTFDFISPERGFSCDVNLSFYVHPHSNLCYVFALLWVSGASIVWGISITSQYATVYIDYMQVLSTVPVISNVYNAKPESVQQLTITTSVLVVIVTVLHSVMVRMCVYVHM